MPPTLFVGIDRDVRELYTRLGVVRDEIFSQRYMFRSLELEQERTNVAFGALWRPVLALEAWAGHVDTRMADLSRARYDDHRLIHDMLVQLPALQRELWEMRGRVTTLEQERDHMPSACGHGYPALFVRLKHNRVARLYRYDRRISSEAKHHKVTRRLDAM
ncbi:hypothetical protein Tco_1290814 [Tanacetum coccineum]